MKANEFVKQAENRVDERRTDEVLPAIGMAARAGASALGKVASKTAKTVGTMAQQAAQKVGAKAVQGAQSAGKSMAQKVAQKATQQMTQQILKKGSKLPIPTQKPGAAPKEFEIDDIQGDEVTLKNPDARLKPEEPEKMVYKKQDLDTIIQNLSQQTPTK